MQSRMLLKTDDRRNTWLFGAPTRAEYVIFGIIGLALWLLFAHPDIGETARHAYILLRSITDGAFFDFYDNVYTFKYGYTYTNAAHYGIVTYLLYALWELPLFLLERLTGAAVSDLALGMWCKALGVGAALGCAALLVPLGRRLDVDGELCQWLPLLFCLHPITLVTVFAMGQYDSLCLVFILLALRYYLDGDLLRFSLLMGVALVFKFFALFVFLPLLLLAEKRLVRSAGYAAAGLWLYLPAALLFRGHTADAGVFNRLMADRLFAVEIPGGIAGTSAFGLVMMAVCVFAWVYRPAGETAFRRAALYLCLTVYTALFLLVLWHPQWVLLVVPFLLLSMGTVRHKKAFVLLELLFAAGFFLLVAFHYPRQLEGDMLDIGLLQPLLGYAYATADNIRESAFYFALIPYLSDLAPLLFHGALAAGLLLKLPLSGQALVDRLSGDAPERRMPWRIYAWGMWLAGFAGCWLLPTLFSYGKTVGLL